MDDRIKNLREQIVQIRLPEDDWEVILLATLLLSEHLEDIASQLHKIKIELECR